VKVVYLAIVLYLGVHLGLELAREKSFWAKAAIAILLVLFILRLGLIK
jgi:hypothetical protein